MLPNNFTLLDLAATKELSRTIAPHLRAGDVVALKGDLGVGKTEFARALLQILGVKGDIPSPTFTLVQSYEVNGKLISHFDLYRLKSSSELEELGWDDAIADGIVLVEWPERAGTSLPKDCLEITLIVSPQGERRAFLDKKGGWQKRL